MSSLRLALKLSMIENPTSTSSTSKETKFDFEDSQLSTKKRKKEAFDHDEDHESKGIESYYTFPLLVMIPLCIKYINIYDR